MKQEVLKLSSFFKDTQLPNGFQPLSTTYDYHPNGNLENDNGRGFTNIEYNHLNLPQLIPASSGSIQYIYDAGGRKLRKIGADVSGTPATKDYAGSVEYKDEILEAIYHADGRITRNQNVGWQYEYSLKDHLGNYRVLFSDLNEDGFVGLNEILQENHYYPFGMEMEGPWEMATSTPTNAYLYNGKEMQGDFGLDWLDYGARMYDPSIGRWNAVDPLADSYTSYSPYNYVLGNPISLIDPDGMRVDDFYVFNENGEYLRTEKNDEPDQIVIENSDTGNRTHVEFNDPEVDVPLLKNAIDFHQGEIPLIHFVKDADINSMMKDSDVSHMKNDYARIAWVWFNSQGGRLSKGKIDFSTYQLPLYVAKMLGTVGRWTPLDVGIDGGDAKRSPMFIFGTENTRAYNWMDGGNWMWGNALNRLGASLGHTKYLSLRNNPNDSKADQSAIYHGWIYHAGYRSVKNLPKQ